MMVAIEITRCLAGDLLEKKLGCELSQKDSAEEPQKEKVMLGDPRQSLV